MKKSTKLICNPINAIKILAFLLVPLVYLNGCSSSFNMPDWMDAETGRQRHEERMQKREGGPSGKVQDAFKLLGSDIEDTGTKIGVNSLLWRSSLDTISFMPLAEADPYGGIIMTEWYVNPNNKNERFKITIYILDTRLRADAVRVSLFMQELIEGEWVNIVVNDDTVLKLENSILTNARKMKSE